MTNKYVWIIRGDWPVDLKAYSKWSLGYSAMSDICSQIASELNVQPQECWYEVCGKANEDVTMVLSRIGVEGRLCKLTLYKVEVV